MTTPDTAHREALEAEIRKGVDAWFASTSEVYAQPFGCENWRDGLTRYVRSRLLPPFSDVLAAKQLSDALDALPAPDPVDWGGVFEDAAPTPPTTGEPGLCACGRPMGHGPAHCTTAPPSGNTDNPVVPTDIADGWYGEFLAARADLAATRTQLAAVEALRDEWRALSVEQAMRERPPHGDIAAYLGGRADDLDAALAAVPDSKEAGE